MNQKCGPCPPTYGGNFETGTCQSMINNSYLILDCQIFIHEITSFPLQSAQVIAKVVISFSELKGWCVKYISNYLLCLFEFFFF